MVHQAWFGGGKLMFAKLLSVLSVRYVLRPQVRLRLTLMLGLGLRLRIP